MESDPIEFGYHRGTMPLFPTTIAGSLPKPNWLAEPLKLWAPWNLEGERLVVGKRDAVRLVLKLQEDGPLCELPKICDFDGKCVNLNSGH